MHKLILITAACLIAPGLAACGGITTSDPRGDVAQAYNTWTANVANGQFHDACQELTPTARKEIEHSLDAHNSCEGVLLFAVGMSGKQAWKIQAKTSDVRVHGATAVIRRLHDTGPTNMRKVNGRWLIDSDAKPKAQTKTTTEPTKTQVTPSPHKVARIKSCGTASNDGVVMIEDVTTRVVECDSARRFARAVYDADQAQRSETEETLCFDGPCVFRGFDCRNGVHPGNGVSTADHRCVNGRKVIRWRERWRHR